jgi:hypothetical protein
MSQWFDPKLSMGNVLTILVVVFGLVGSWYQLRSDLALQAADLKRETADRTRMELRLVKLEGERDDTRDRLTRIEVTMQQLLDAQGRILRAVEKGGQ